jgi:hypothetical protein
VCSICVLYTGVSQQVQHCFDVMRDQSQTDTLLGEVCVTCLCVCLSCLCALVLSVIMCVTVWSREKNKYFRIAGRAARASCAQRDAAVR